MLLKLKKKEYTARYSFRFTGEIKSLSDKKSQKISAPPNFTTNVKEASLGQTM